MQILRNPRNGQALEATATMYPCRLEVVEGERRAGAATSTSYAFVLDGRARFRAGDLEFASGAGGFACLPGEVEIEAGGRVVVIERLGFRGVPTCGAIEDKGRLAYIDGCSDTILCMPPRQGDPVFNHLHFPRGIEQSQHTHPSIRLGVVARGEGFAFARGPGSAKWQEPLAAGSVFLLEAHEPHAFSTLESGAEMDVIAFHPDSD
ncbi:MAG TPA: hypothetical protein VHB21_15430, partial [Minicystis sp.]|nr:hypothetical protein [Minicystis sp.]